MFLSPSTMPTPRMWPTAPHASVSARVNPAGSPVCSPESRASSFSPAVAFRFADGASPNRPANSISVVVVTMICIYHPSVIGRSSSSFTTRRVVVSDYGSNCYIYLTHIYIYTYQVGGGADVVAADALGPLPADPHGRHRHHGPGRGVAPEAVELRHGGGELGGHFVWRLCRRRRRSVCAEWCVWWVFQA